METFKTDETTQQGNHNNVIPSGVTSSISGNNSLKVLGLETFKTDETTQQGNHKNAIPSEVASFVSGINSLKVLGSTTFTDWGMPFKKDSLNLSFMRKTRYNGLRNLPESPTSDVDPAGCKPLATLCAS